MDKINMFKAMLPLIPPNYRRILIFYIHFEEMMNIMASLKKCLNTPISDFDDGSLKNPNDLLGFMKKNMSKQDSEMFDMFSMFSGGFGGSSSSPDNSGSEDFSEDIDNLFKDFLNSDSSSDNGEKVG